MNLLKQRITKLVRGEIQNLTAYQVQDATDLIKLDAMESPFDWPGNLQQEWLAELQTISLNRYPDPECRSLRDEILAYFNAPTDVDVLLGNGSDELISLLMQLVAGPQRTVCSFSPSFVMYQLIACYTHSQYLEIPLTPQFTIDLNATLDTIQRHQPELIFIARPNNPTGNCFATEEITTIVDAADGLVIIDEAYHAFADSSLLPLCVEYPNVLVLHTLSKVGLAGLRLGMLFGRNEWLNELNKIRLPYNIGSLTQATTSFALRKGTQIHAQVETLKQEREKLSIALNKISCLTVYPSEANFILFRTPTESASDIFTRLKASGILLKNLSHSHPLLKDCLRVTVSTAEQNQAFLTALKQALDSN